MYTVSYKLYITYTVSKRVFNLWLSQLHGLSVLHVFRVYKLFNCVIICRMIDYIITHELNGPYILIPKSLSQTEMVIKLFCVKYFTH